MNLPVRKLIVLVTFVLIATRAEAVPLLQLDIIDGVYDSKSDTIVADSERFTLVALLTPQNQNANAIAALLADTYYVSAAVIPGADGETSGSFRWQGTPYNVTTDMAYGTPPFEQGDLSHDAGDLGTHDVFPAYFREFSFQFLATQRAMRYDSEKKPGGLTPTSATRDISYYMLFDIVANVGDDTLHFDLYNTLFKDCPKKQPNCIRDEDVGKFAPFSHDAESGHSPASVPEPSNLMLLGIGVVTAARFLRRRKGSDPNSKGV